MLRSMSCSLLVSVLIFSVVPCYSQDPREYPGEQIVVLETETGGIYGSLVSPTSDSCNTVVLIVADAGHTNRNGNQQMGRNNSLKFLAYTLAANNIASLRYDKRGVGASREATLLKSSDNLRQYVDDVSHWVSYLNKYQNYDNIVVLGHGEGAHLSMLALNGGSKADMFISVSAPGRMAGQILKDMFVDKPHSVRMIANDIIDSLEMGHQVKEVPFFLNSMFNHQVQPYIRTMMKFNPQKQIREIDIPILIIQGDADHLVRVEDARLLHAANPDSRLVIIPSMNHVMKHVQSKSLAEIQMNLNNPAIPLERTFVPTLIEFIRENN